MAGVGAGKCGDCRTAEPPAEKLLRMRVVGWEGEGELCLMLVLTNRPESISSDGLCLFRMYSQRKHTANGALRVSF